MIGHHFFTRFHHRHQSEESSPRTTGSVINWAWRYDRLVWFLTLGREQALRQMTADLAQLHPGETVLDVGCGTGTMAMVARQRVGTAGQVSGIDPAPQMIALARRKAARRGLAIDFQIGLIEQLPFPDHSFNVVLSTLMMHHLPDNLKRQGLQEIARVLKPEGRLLILDFKHPEQHQRQPASHTHTGEKESSTSNQNQPTLMKEAGFSQIETGTTKFPGLEFALGRINKA